MTLGKAEKGPGSVTKEGSHVGSVQEVKIEKGIAGGETRMSRGTKERVGLARSSPMTAAQGVWEGRGVETGAGAAAKDGAGAGQADLEGRGAQLLSCR